MEIVNWNLVIYWADQIIFLIFLLPVGYLLIFSMASIKRIRTTYPKAKKHYRYAVFFPAKMGVDEDIIESVKSFMSQDYPKEKFDIIIISDGLIEKTVTSLKESGSIVIERSNNEPGRKSALEDALKILDPSNYDVAILMKPNNTVEKNYLSEINKAYHSGGMAIQTHRMSKRTRSNLNTLSALAEEINNSIFRRGHVNLGFSSSLIGSGMAFNYKWFQQNIPKLGSPGLTKQLEAALLKQGIYIEYLENICTYDEKTKNVSAYNKQRKGWSKAKRFTLKDAFKDFPKALFSGNFDYCVKIFQWIMPSRFILLSYIIIIALLLPTVEWTLSLKWWILLGVLLLSFSLSIPEKYVNIRTFWALLMLPFTMIIIIGNKILSKIRG